MSDAPKKKRSISGAGRRAKGAGFEREVAAAFAFFYPRAIRGLGQARAGNEIPDVCNTPFWVECKRCIRPNILGAFKQSREAVTTTATPQYRDCPIVVVTKANHGESMVTITLALFTELLEAASKGAPEGWTPKKATPR